ncbi:uncharacterized protein B0P05DRAFT_592861 [Gilbertella persicaria]|uniref:uncharacterized protein n=1 Tax=Gilbertella persicaria TaxID=101096 RepID=UPI002220E306|nr:uncharacterized protein B0P05DRAFT_592861 [Gilbertella persicaria]KAI8047052.1 hypothetical protein B0P05DRAFT_592861 [Gilbertella persicaria]
MSKKTLSAFYIPQDLLSQLSPVGEDTEVVLEQQQEAQDVTAQALERLQIQQERLDNQESENNLGCNTCEISFVDRDEQRQHFGSDWHRYNIKRKVVLNVKPVSFEEFETLLADLTESISGSESETDEEEDNSIDSLVYKQKQVQELEAQLANDAKQIVSPIMKKYLALNWFKTPEKDSPHYGIYRHLLNGKTLASLQQSNFKGKRYWTIIMLGGGHFAGCVIDVGASNSQIKLVAHRTIHRYTTRRKQGGSQSTNDNAKGAANSAGAQIRRYNEQMLQQEVREIIGQWRQYITSSEMVVVHAPSGNRKLLFNYDDAVLDTVKTKSIPFATKRPTLNELKRVFTEMTTVKIMQVDEQAVQDYKQKWIEKEEKAKRQLEKSTMINKKTIAPQKPTIDPHLEKLLSLVRQNKTTVTLNYLEKHMNLPVSGLLPTELADVGEDLYHHPTLLHMVASMGNAADLVKALLIGYDADPTIVSGAGKTAYEVSKDKETRNAFRRCINDYPDKWAWLEEARVPSPLTEKQEQDQIAKEKKKQAKEQEKKRLIELERAKLEAEKEAKESQAQLEKTQKARAKKHMLPLVPDNMVNTANMTPEARMRLEREKRARAAEERMKRFK